MKEFCSGSYECPLLGQEMSSRFKNFRQVQRLWMLRFCCAREHIMEVSVDTKFIQSSVRDGGRNAKLLGGYVFRIYFHFPYDRIREMLIAYRAPP